MEALGMLNALIGIVLVYFVLSLIVSAVVEWITQMLGERGKVLELATARLLGLREAPAVESGGIRPGGTSISGVGDGEGARKQAFHAFFNHPQVQALQQNSSRRPSYIPSATFAAAFAEATLELTMRELRNAPGLLRSRVEALPEPLRANLLGLLDEADGDPVRFIAGIESWVGKTWERAAGWLRRRISWRLFLVGFAVALMVNADTVRMFQVLTRDTGLQQRLVETAGQLAAQGSGASLDQVLCDGETTTDAGVPKQACDELKVARRYALDVSPLLGWDRDWDVDRNPWWWYLGKLVGLLITASALLMGAPFWFDMLKKLVSMRQSLRAGATAAEVDGLKSGSASAASAASAVPTAVAPSRVRLERPTVPSFQPQSSSYCPENILWLSRLAGITYEERRMAEARGTEWGYAISGKFDAVRNDTQYLIAETADSIVLVFRGTEPSRVADILTDANFQFTPCAWCQEARLHKGFAEALDHEWRTIVVELKARSAGKVLWIAGHSLGGSLALLAAHRLTCENSDLSVQGVVTFGQPRCGDQAFVDDVERKLAGRYWRVIDNRDLVPRVPPYAMSYRHAGTVIYLDDLGRVSIDPPLWYRVLDNLDLPLTQAELRKMLSERVADHSIERYIQTLASVVGQAE